jgi:hypothetical protein
MHAACVPRCVPGIHGRSASPAYMRRAGPSARRGATGSPCGRARVRRTSRPRARALPRGTSARRHARRRGRAPTLRARSTRRRSGARLPRRGWADRRRPARAPRCGSCPDGQTTKLRASRRSPASAFSERASTTASQRWLRSLVASGRLGAAAAASRSSCSRPFIPLRRSTAGQVVA